MPAKSKAQQRIMGIAYSIKIGKKKLSDIKDEDFRDTIQKLVDNMTKKDLKDFAKTKYADIKEFKLYSFQEFISEFSSNASLNPGMTVPGIGNIKLPSSPDLPIASQSPGSGDMPMYIPPKETKYKKKKKKKKKKKESEL